MNRKLKLFPLLGIFALMLTQVAHGQVDDVYENNDTVGQALTSEFDFTDGETLLGLRQLDDDWYHIVVSPEDGNPPQVPPLPSASITLQIDCFFEHATAGNIDVEVYVRSRAVDDQGVKAQGLFSVFGFLPLAGDTVTIGTKTYTWQATATADGEIAIGADAAEARDNFVAAVNGTDGINSAHTQVTATAFAGFSAVVTAIAEGSIGNTIVTTETSVSTSFDANTLGTFRLGVDAAVILVAIADSVTDNESITLPHMAAGEYFIRVKGPNIGGRYSLWWDYLQDDVYEENDSIQQATPIAVAVTLTSLRQVDEDWYEVVVSGSGTGDMVVDCAFVQATAGNIDVEIYNSSGSSVVGVGDSQTDNETVIVPNVQPGTYYIRVYAGGPDANIGGDYTLSWNGSGGSLDDSYEENDTVAEAVPIAEAVTLTSLRQADEDWFEVTVSAGSGTVDLQVDLTFTHAIAGDINVGIYNSTGATLIGVGDSVTDNESVTVPDVQPGTYYIRVYGGLGANIGGTYSLTWNDVGDTEDAQEYLDLAAYYRSAAYYYYYYYTYFGSPILGYAYYSYYESIAAYYTSLSNGDNAYIAYYYYYLWQAQYFYYAYAAVGDYQSAEYYYYYHLAVTYYYYYVGIGDMNSANAIYALYLSYAFG